MSRRSRTLTPADIEVWHAVAETIAHRLPGASLPAKPEVPRRGALGPALPQPAPTAPGWSPPVPTRIASGPGEVERALRKRVKAGRQAIEASLDLHGFRQGEAHARLQRFITDAHRDGLRMVVVVTGKGRTGSEDGERGVLRRLVPLWLAEPRLAPFVVGFGAAARGHGGEGALYVHLRSRTRLEHVLR